MNSHYNRFRRFCAVLTGIVFVLSGSFKLMDPVGTSLVTGEYLSFLHLNFLQWAAMPLAIALGLLETALGIALVSGVLRKIAAIVAFSLCAFFTLITVLLVIFNPSMDCGCFGDVVHLTHMQSLLKNIVLMALCCLAFIPFRDYGSPKWAKMVGASMTAASSLALLVWSLTALPLKDYTDLRPGTRLSASLQESESAVFEAVFIYSKDGEERAFSLDDELPDSTWTFERAEAVTAQEDNVPLGIHNPLTGEDADSLLAYGNVLVISTYRGSEVLDDRALKLLEDYRDCGGTALHLALNAYDSPDTYLCDRRSLMALNRSNGGATLLQDGLVVKKWPASALPSLDELNTLSSGEALDNISDVRARSDFRLQAYFIWIFCTLLLI